MSIGIGDTLPEATFRILGSEGIEKLSTDDVFAKKKVVLFAVPGFCESRLCGPELEIMRKLYPQYRNRVEFIHVEFYKNPGNPERIPSDTVVEWKLRSEPWFFLIDSKGMIAAKYEGPVSLQELDEALKAVN